MRRANHPNVVQIYEVTATKSKIYFVIEFAKGGDRFNKVAKGKLKGDVTRKYFRQLISAVDNCRSRSAYHRNLKLENLLLDQNGDLKVSDFRLSAPVESRCQDVLLHTVCGTPAYAALEVLCRKGFHLSCLFTENDEKKAVQFTSTSPASSIVSNLEDVARNLRLKVKKNKGCVKWEGSKEGRKGSVSVQAEIYEFDFFLSSG